MVALCDQPGPIEPLHTGGYIYDIQETLASFFFCIVCWIYPSNATGCCRRVVKRGLEHSSLSLLEGGCKTEKDKYITKSSAFINRILTQDENAETTVTSKQPSRQVGNIRTFFDLSDNIGQITNRSNDTLRLSCWFRLQRTRMHHTRMQKTCMPFW